MKNEFDINKFESAYLNPEEPTKYPFRVRVEVVETYFVDVMATTEEDSYFIAEEFVASHNQADITDVYDADDVTYAELDGIEVNAISSEESME